MNLPQEFEDSYINFHNYPRNLVYKSSSSFALDAFKDRLDEAAPRLCMSSDVDTNVRILDPPLPGSQNFQEHIITGDAALRTYLGDTAATDPQNQTRTGHLATKADPRCRFIFLWAAHSRAKLKINRLMLVRLLSYFQVMQGYLHFLTIFGQQTQPHNARFSDFRSQTVLSGSVQGREISDLERSGRQYQLCYNLKSVSCTSLANEPTRTRQWSIRQIGLCHQFDVVKGTTLWLITKGAIDIKEHIQNLLGTNGRTQDKSFGTPSECFTSSLAAHLLITHWASEGWRSYLQWLEDVVDAETKSAVVGPRGFKDGRREYKPEDLQTVQQFEEKTHEAIMVLEGNTDVLRALCEYYEALMKNQGFTLQTSCAEAVTSFITQVNDALYDAKMQVARAKLLLRITSDRKALILQHLQTQQTEKMETLTVLAQKEAIAMRIITVVTLVYLPATFVSTFFSTDIVKYQDQSSSPGSGSAGTSFSEVAMTRWLQVTFPLTFVTLVGGWIGYKWAERKKRTQLPFYASFEPKKM